MKYRKTSAFLLAASIVLCSAGCNGDVKPPESESAVQEQTSSELTSGESSTTTAATSGKSSTTTAATTSAPEKEQPKQPKSFSSATMLDLKNMDVRFKENGRDLFYDFFDTVTEEKHSLSLRDNMIFVDSDDIEIFTRSTSTALREDSWEFTLALSKTGYVKHKAFPSGYDIQWEDVEFSINPDCSEGIKPEKCRLGYEVSFDFKAPMTTYGFVKLNEGGKGEFILDPAYARGLPLLSGHPDNMRFNINGKEIYADTLSFEFSYSEGEYPAFEKEYAYVKASVGGWMNVDFVVNADGTSYYRNSIGGGFDFETVTEDTDKAINDPYSMVVQSAADKDPLMTEVYDAIMADIGTIHNENTTGIVLLDMDFDGTPEVLTSELRFDIIEGADDPSAYQWGVDVDVYRVKDGGLKYIDTIYNKHMEVYSITNNLGLKTLPDGTKAWFSSSYKGRDEGREGVDYLYTLEGDTLKHTEVFGYGDEYQFTDEGITMTANQYYMGEKMIPDIIHEELTPEEMEGAFSDTHLDWGGVSSYWGDMWELFGFAREAYCEDIEVSYFLYSPWLSNIVQDGSRYDISRINRKEDLQIYELTPREVSFNIANLVDEFFLGEYNSAEYKYEYYFLGDYAKPVIYLYPEETTEVSVSVEFADEGEITVSYPEYNDGWSVTAHPDGTLFDEDGNEYYCLYWEGEGSAALDMSRGWCVNGADTAAFLREKLMYIGLTAREANEFIIYWLPLMQKNEYNIITLHTEEYDAAVPMTVTPAPDSMIRVFMTYAPAEEWVNIVPQELPTYERNGFTVVEWGGGIIDN